MLLKAPEGLLEASGPNSRSARVMKFAEVAQIEARREVILAYIDEAISNERAGLKVDFPKDDRDWPEELAERPDADADADPELDAAFRALTPGRQRGYVLNISQAKQTATRVSRVEKWAPRILDGRGMRDR